MARHELSLLAYELLEIARSNTSCDIQHNGCPCNTCFHTWACEEIGDFYGHLFWLLILGIRGDNDEKSIRHALKSHLNEEE